MILSLEGGANDYGGEIRITPLADSSINPSKNVIFGNA